MNLSQLNDAMELARSHEQSNRQDLAEAIYRNLITSYPQYHPPYQSLGLMAFAAGNLPFAAQLFQSAIACGKHVGVYHRNFGEICRRLGRVAEAVESGREACRLMPMDIDSHFNLALALSDARLPEETRQAFSRVVELQETADAHGNSTPKLWNQRAVALHRMERFAEARESYEKVLALDPEFVAAHNGLGSALRETGFLAESLEHLTKAVQLSPGFADARLNLGMTQMQLGDWHNGWENYEARWTGSIEGNTGTFARPHCPLPQWSGSGETENQAILIFAEQGFGDAFQFSRYIDLLAARFAKIAVVFPWNSVQLLMESSFGDRVLLLKQMPHDFTLWDWHCPLMSLPRAFRSLPGNVPANVPYLKVSLQAKRYWKERLDRATTAQLRIGVAWQGRRSHQYDLRRSVEFARLTPLLQEENITWVSLQKFDENETPPTVPADVRWIDWTGELLDFSDTAALMSNLDLIISIDSSMAHLAGALGKPVWMLNRFDSEWRWMRQSETSVWYPSMRIFNQPKFADWDSVIANAKSALQELRSQVSLNS